MKGKENKLQDTKLKSTSKQNQGLGRGRINVKLSDLWTRRQLPCSCRTQTSSGFTLIYSAWGRREFRVETTNFWDGECRVGR